MIRYWAMAGTVLCLLLAVLAVAGCYELGAGQAASSGAMPNALAQAPILAAPAAPLRLPDPQPLPVAQVLRAGTLIVISKASQKMYVFQDGALWQTSPVSTGRRGHATPSGVFTILQKAVFHRSNKYSNAPMPFMQRLSWDGIAIHAGRLPGYAASHGCIRLPRGFAQALYAKTRASTTTVVVTNEAIAGADSARSLALNAPLPHVRGAVPSGTQLAAGSRPAAASPTPRIEPELVDAIPTPGSMPPVPSPPHGPTIQLAAAASPQLADAEWQRLVAAHPGLARFQKRIEPAIVNARRTYRLRASAADARATCAALQRANVPCFNVI